MFDYSQIYLTPHPDVHVSPNLSPKAVPEPAFPAPHPPAFDPQRISPYPSEPESTTAGSDSERVFSSGDEDSMGFHSDTLLDSVSQTATMSGDPSTPGLEVERIFVDLPASEITKQSLLPLGEIIPHGSCSESSIQDGISVDGLDSLSTPRDDHSSAVKPIDNFTTPVAIPENWPQLDNFPSSPPPTAFPESFYREQARTELVAAEMEQLALHDSELWDDEIYPTPALKDTLTSPQLPQHSPWRMSPPLLGAHILPTPPPRQGVVDIREEKRLSIFDWSEQQRSDRDSPNGSSPRPRTVHSKHGNDGRSGRALGRRAPNALHLRSQSVPATKESYLESNPGYPPNKFGTWGLGKKGVSEEWTDDFEFDEVEVEENETQHDPERWATGMRVPQSIIDRQASVHGQFGQVQEFMLLVEELKRLRHRGTLLNVIGESSHHLWEDAENIINLATLNEEDDGPLPPLSPCFSNGFDDFDEEFSPAHRSRPPYHPSAGDESKAIPTGMLSSAPATPAAGRPRGESLAQAKNFLQTMHQSRTGIDSSPFEDRSHPPKLPFDTQDLRDLVTRAGVATRALKEVVRNAEGVFTSPGQPPKEPQDPPFSQIFNRPESPSPVSKKPSLVKSTSVNSYISRSLANSNHDRDRPGHMNMMTVV